MKTKIRVISLDCWDTVLRSAEDREHSPRRRQVVRQWMHEWGLGIDDSLFDEYWKECSQIFWSVWENRHITVSTPERLEIFLKKTGASPDEDEIEALADSVEAVSLNPVPLLTRGFMEALNSVPTSIRLAMISDTGWSSGATIRKLLAAQKVLNRFSCMVFSDEMGCSKPCSRMFQKVMDDLDVNPEQVLHIGDIERTDVEGARNMGMNSAIYTGEVDRLNGGDSRADFKLAHWCGLLDILQELE